MRTKPLGDRVELRPLEKKERPSGIVLPDTAEKEKIEIGEVVALGEGHRTVHGELYPLTLKVGDKVIYDRRVPHEYKEENGVIHLLVREDNIFAIIDEGEAKL